MEPGVELTRAIVTVNIIYVIGAALTCYDHLLTVRDEVRLIWRRRVSSVTIIFVLTRYGALVNAAVVIAQIPSTLYEGGSSCNVLNGLTTAAHMMVYVGLGTFSCFRLYAITNKNRKLASFTAVLMIGFLSLQAYYNIASATDDGASAFGPGCRQVTSLFDPKTSHISLAEYAGLACGLVAEIIVQVSTWTTTWKTYRFLKEHNMNHRLTSLLLRDGTFVFSFVLVWSIISELTYQGLLSSMNPVFFSVAVCRFILRLRQVYLPDNASAIRPSPSTILGNIGATIYFSADSERDDESEDEEVIIIPEAPLGTSLSVPCTV